MNMMEFVKLFRKMDILEGNDNMLFDLCKKLVKNQRRFRSLFFMVGVECALIWIYNSMTDKELKDLKKRVEELEKHDLYSRLVVPDQEEVDEDDILR